jgi:hypothetical protein
MKAASVNWTSLKLGISILSKIVKGTRQVGGGKGKEDRAKSIIPTIISEYNIRVYYFTFVVEECPYSFVKTHRMYLNRKP